MDNKQVLEEFNYNYFSECVCKAKNMNCEEIINLHKTLIGQKYQDGDYIRNYGRNFIFKMLNYDYGYIIPKEIPEELSKFFNSKHVSDYFKQLIKENLSNPSEIVSKAINSERDFKDFDADEFYAIENELNAAGFHNVMLGLAFKLNSSGATDFLNKKVDPITMISRIVLTSGLNSRAEYYSGRGAMTCDLNEEHLISIFHKLERLGTNKALSMAKMTFSMPTLGATEFLESLYRLAYNNFELETTEISTNNTSLGNAKSRERNIVAIGILGTAFGGYHRDDTEVIKSQFERLLPKEVVCKIYPNTESYDADRWGKPHYGRRRRKY